MEARQRELVVVTLAVLLLSAVSSRAFAQDGTATGHLTLNGETTPLTHAYASAQPGFFDKAMEDIRILLSDVELPDSALGDVFELIHMGRDGRAHVVEVVLDAEAAPIFVDLIIDRAESRGPTVKTVISPDGKLSSTPLSDIQW